MFSDLIGKLVILTWMDGWMDRWVDGKRKEEKVTTQSKYFRQDRSHGMIKVPQSFFLKEWSEH